MTAANKFLQQKKPPRSAVRLVWPDFRGGERKHRRIPRAGKRMKGQGGTERKGSLRESSTIRASEAQGGAASSSPCSVHAWAAITRLASCLFLPCHRAPVVIHICRHLSEHLCQALYSRGPGQQSRAVVRSETRRYICISLCVAGADQGRKTRGKTINE